MKRRLTMTNWSHRRFRLVLLVPVLWITQLALLHHHAETLVEEDDSFGTRTPVVSMSSSSSAEDTSSHGDRNNNRKQTSPRRSDLSVTNTRLPLLAFVRIHKTGSTSLLMFLTYASGLSSWDNFIYSGTNYVRATRGEPWVQKSPFCVFGDTNGIQIRHDHRDGDNPYPYNRRDIHNWCPHVKRAGLEKFWRRSLRFVRNPQIDKASLSLQTVTMVREPFDRFRSMFYFVRKFCGTTHAWKGMFTEAQYDQICHGGSFARWLELLHTQEENHRIPYQFYFMDDDVTNAIALMDEGSRDDDEGVYMLINECFEESLWFLEHRFSLKPGVAADFARSERFHTRKTNKQSPAQSTQDVMEERELRQKAKKWFANEYDFYNAAVRQFQRQMETVDIDPLLLRNRCDLLQRQEKEKR